jgi:polyisoprenoid-binding protein YceI
MMRFMAIAGLFALLLPGAAHAAGEDGYSLNKPHTQILFSVSHLGFTQSHGKFLDYTGTLKLDESHPENSVVDAVIHTASVDMGDDAWSKKVREIFKVDKYPDMIFKSTEVKRKSEKTADVTGNLTMLGVTKPVTLHVTFNKEGRDPFGKYVAGFSAEADIQRSAFGMNDYAPAVGDEVHIILEAEADRKDKPGQEQYNQ